jgi:hypothetical protein
VRVQGAAAGLYAALHLPAELDEQKVLAAARSRGIALEGLGGATPGLVVGYANLSDAAIEPAVAELAASVQDAASHPRGDPAGPALRQASGRPDREGRAAKAPSVCCNYDGGAIATE